jgi:hypothetical protein
LKFFFPNLKAVVVVKVFTNIVDKQIVVTGRGRWKHVMPKAIELARF